MCVGNFYGKNFRSSAGWNWIEDPDGGLADLKINLAVVDLIHSHKYFLDLLGKMRGESAF